jgi:primosomal protein N' (replication factor Y)
MIGPAIPSIARIRNLYINTITIKLEKDPQIVHRIKQLIMETREKIRQIPACKSVKVVIDVDPY